MLSIRSKLSLWYTLMLMVFLSAGFALLYFAVKEALSDHSNENILRDAGIIATEVEMERYGPRFDMDDDTREALSGGLIYALYDHNNTWQDGRRSLWLDEYELQFDKIRSVSHNGEKWLLIDKEAYEDDESIGYIRVLLPLSSMQETLNNILLVGLIGFLPCLILAMLGGLAIASVALRPIRLIAKTAQLIGRGKFGETIEVHTKDEVGELAEAINEMSTNIDLAFEREKCFTSDVSHEMRTPLAVIMAHAEEAIQKENLAIYKTSMQAVLEKSRQMQGIFAQMLQLARFYEQEKAMQLDELDLSSVLKDIASEIREQAAANNIELSTNIATDLYMQADLLIFTRMMMNLLDNAIKYSKDGGQIQLEARRLTMGIEITVSDKGCGIATDDLPHIFNRFYRADKARNAQGAGLGLSFVEQAVHLHKGQITVESTLGQGSSFRICFTQ